MTAILDASAVSKSYPGADVKAVDDVTLSLDQGEIVGLLGPNGAGKTSLIKLICGVTSPSSGRLRVFGADPANDPITAKSGVGVMHQSCPFDMMLSALDNLKIAARFKGLRWREARAWVDELLESVELTGQIGKQAFQLSGGQRQRLSLVRSLIVLPRLLILDEPSNGLDVGGRRQIWNLVSRLRAEHGVTVLWTSHYIEEIERNCERILLLHQGRLIRDAAPDGLIQEFGNTGLEVVLADANDFDRLALWAGARDLAATIEHSTVRITGHRARENMIDLLRYTQESGFDIEGISMFTSSLEDAFVRFTEVAGSDQK